MTSQTHSPRRSYCGSCRVPPWLTGGDLGAFQGSQGVLELRNDLGGEISGGCGGVIRLRLGAGVGAGLGLGKQDLGILGV